MLPAIETSQMRLIWSLIDTHCQYLGGLSDEAICMWIASHIRRRIHLTDDEMINLRRYIAERTHLIRDMAEPGI